MKTTKAYQSELDVLKNILKLSYSTKLMYEQLLANTNEEEVKEFIQLKVDILSDFVYSNILKLKVAQIEIVVHEDLKDRIKRFLTTIKYSFLGYNNVDLINESLKLDNALYVSTSKAIESIDTTSSLIKNLEEQKEIFYEMIQPREYANLYTIS